MHLYLNTKDFMLTGEEFQLVHDPLFDMLQTIPIPVNLSDYYNSDTYISHTDSKKTIIDKIYQLVKKYSLHKKEKIIRCYASQNKRLLDIGAGTGDFLRTAQKKGWETEGIEPNSFAREKATEKNINLCEHYHDLTNKAFDTITLWHVLEHLPNLEEQLQEIKKRLAPKGTLVIAVPNYKSYDARYYKQYWAAYDVPRHLHHFSRKSIPLLFEKYGITLVGTKPMIFDSFYVSLLSEKYKTGKSNFIKALYIGFISNLKALFSQEYSSLIYVLKNE